MVKLPQKHLLFALFFFGFFFQTSLVSANTPQLVKDIYSGANGSTPKYFVYNRNTGKLYFQATTPDYGAELWQTDGTVAGTSQVMDLNPGTSSSNPTYLTVTSAGQLIFQAQNGSDTGICYLAGTSYIAMETTLPSDFVMTRLLSRTVFPKFDSGVFYQGVDGNNGNVLWGDGGQVYNYPRAALYTNTNSYPLNKFLSLNSLNTLFRVDKTGANGNGDELWFVGYDGNQPDQAISQLLMTSYGTDDTALGNFTLNLSDDPYYPTADFVVFTADNGSTGTEPWVWRSFNIEQPVDLLMDINPGSASSYPQNVVYVYPLSLFFFQANDGSTGNEPWVTDGTPESFFSGSTHILKDIDPGENSGGFTVPMVAGSNVFFSSLGGLWITDGTEAGTSFVKAIYPEQYIATVGNKVFFRANDGTNGRELWVSDGTEAGTFMVKDLRSGSGGINSFFDPIVIDDTLYFAIIGSYVGESNYAMVETDGTEAGTNVVMGGLLPMDTGPEDTDRFFFATIGKKIFFTASDATYGQELWLYDTTPIPVPTVTSVSPGEIYRNNEDNPSFTILGNNFGAAAGAYAAAWISNGLNTFNLIPSFWSATQIIAQLASLDIVAGDYDLYVNNSGLESVSSFLSNALTVLSDDTAPVSASNLLVTSSVPDAQPNFSWTAASDADSGLATNPYEVSWSQASDFSGAVTRRTSTTSYELSESDALASNGVWYVRVRALDKVGNWSDYVSTQFVFDNTAPVFSSSLTVDSPTSESLQTWSWGAATDNLSTVSYAWRMTDAANSEVGSGTLTDTEQYASNLTEGTWHFYLKAIDGYGNESAEQTATLVVDLSAPAIIADFSAQGAISDPEGDMVADSTPTLEWSAAVDASDLADPAYDLRFGTSSSYASSSALISTNELSYQLPEALADGIYYFWVSATDVLGHQSESRSLKLYIDTTAPTVPEFNTNIVPIYTKYTTWNIPWLIPTDETLGEKVLSFRLERSLDPSFPSESTRVSNVPQTVANNYPIAYMDSASVDATYYYRLQASDYVGNTSDWSETTFVLLDRSAPATPTGVALQEGAASSETRPTLQWDANQEDTLTYTVAWSQSATFSDSVQTTELTESSFRPSSALAEGQWYFRVLSTDLAENQSAWSDTVSILIDTTAPTAPGLPSTTSPTNQSSQQWLWTAGSDNNSNFSYTWRITDAEGNETSAGTTSDTELTTELSEGTWYFYITTIDVAGNQSQERSGVVQVDFTDPEAAAIAATATNNSVRFSWLSPELTSAKVSYGYGINGNLEWSVEDLTAKEGNQYLDADSLAACSQYYYRLQLTDLAGNQRTSGFYSFQTGGCLGDASIVESHSGEVIREASASVSLAGDTGTLTLEVPAEVSSQSSLLIHINKINTQDVVSAAPTTTGSAVANGQTYDIKALLDGVTEVTQFDHPITLVLSYADSILTGMKEETLRLKWWSGTAWEELDNCQLDTGVKTLTCQTSHFSTFAVIGELNPVTPTPAPGGTGSSESSGSSSSGGGSASSVCNATRPSGAADLFQINRTGSVADLYVSPAGNPYTRYMVAYGSNLRTDQYTAFFDYRNASGVMVFEIADLDPNSQYTFKVQVLNGCQFGDWSNSLTIARARANSQQIFYKGFTSQLNLKATAAVSTLTNIFYRRPVETSPTEPAPIQNTLPTDSQSQVTGPAVQETQGSAQQPLAPVVNNSATQVGAKSFSSKVSNWVRSLFSF